MRLHAITAVLVLGGCGIDPQPEPPVIDVSQLQLVNADGDLHVRGVATEAMTVRAVAFATDSLPVDVPVGEGFAFDAPLGTGVIEGDDLSAFIVHVQAFGEAGRSLPIEIVPTGDGGVAPPPDILGGCVTLSTTDLDFGAIPVGDVAVERVRATNSCPDTMFTLEGTYAYQDVTEIGETPDDFRPPVFAGVHAYGIELPPMSSRQVALVFTPTAPGLVEDYVFVEVRNGPPGNDIPDDPLDPPSINIQALTVTVRGTGQ